jgi:glutamate carboxypeptidase
LININIYIFYIRNFNLVTAQDILDGLRPWVECESPTSDAEAVNKVMSLAEHDWKKIGFEVERIPGKDGFGDHLSIKTNWRSDSVKNEKGILILSHLDTVHPHGSFEQGCFLIDEDTVTGPGILDMKGGAYIAFIALKLISQGKKKPKLPVHILFTSDEEVGSPTSRSLIEAAGNSAKYVLVTEPARSDGKIVTSRRGVGRFKIITRGRAAHAGVSHFDGKSAIKEMAKQILVIEAMTDYERGLTLNVGKIKGGSADNTVPDYCEATIDLRVENSQIVDEISNKLMSLKSLDTDINVEVSGGINRPPFIRTEGGKDLFEHAKLLASEIGFDLEGIHTGGGSDGSFLAKDIPTLDGLGVDGVGPHTLNEHMFVSSLLPRMTLLKRLIETLN